MNDLAPYLFHQGTNFSAYDYLGCTLSKEGKKFVYTFRTWAPNAYAVGLISDFSGWDDPVPFERKTENGIWELIWRSDFSLEKKAYKFRITSATGTVNKGDPYARFSRGLDDGASLIFTSNKFKWSDGLWRRSRKKQSKGEAYLSVPINIYEVHAGSFMRHDDGSVLSYRELADSLAPYVKVMGYTHVELLPIMEHPYDGSWGYQVCGFYAPTSRYGDPDDFRYFVNKLHKTGIGVILDWVPAHFPKDEWGLYEFDGRPLYEYQGKDRQESSSWGTRFFDLGREEVQSFLISNALYYLREFHVDGLRVDAVASMLYLDYDRLPGEWIPNRDGTNISLEALAFFKKLNTAVFAEFPEALMIAEESGDYGNLTRPVYDMGLGFNLKWNMGWANDFYEYLSSDPVYRKYNHKALNFPLMYAFTENYCLPISHDEVVHGKRSLINKMHGSYEDKFDQMRTALLLMMTYPGKKLMFMGTEFAQFREWNYADELEWFMLDYQKHTEMRDYVRALNHFYLSSHELWSLDFDPSGFSWLLANEAEKNCVAFRRIAKDKSSVIVLINFSGADQELTFKVSECDMLKLSFATAPGKYDNMYFPFKEGENYYATVKLPRFSGVILKEASNTKVIKI
ncbi:MAG: 1,4-alpha-glucan branching protein GlgB [Clostridia bacterium]|nr:1,4-alpha-glucan branching protein GlgB [Clostridia bacterium]